MTVQSAASTFQLNLLDGFELTVCTSDLQTIIEVPGQKSRALFCILALEAEKPLLRSYLAELLWDDMPTDQAAMNLRQTLSVIKRALGDQFGEILEVTKQTIRLRQGMVTVDVNSPELIDSTSPDILNLFSKLGVRSRRFETWLNDQHNKVLKGTILRSHRALNQALDMTHHKVALGLGLRLHALEPDNDANTLQVHQLMLALGQNHEAMSFLKDNPNINSTTAINDSLPVPTANQIVSPIVLIGRFNCKPDDKTASTIALALSEAVVGDLTESAWVRVMAPDLINLSSPIFGLTANLPTQVAWNYRLDGAIQSSPLAVSVWLTSGTDQTVIWTEKFTGDSVGALADHIVSRVTASLESVVLDAEGKRSTHARTIAGYWEDLACARLLIWRATQSTNHEAEILLNRMLEDAPHDIRVLTLAAYAKLINAWSAWDGSTASNLDQAARIARRGVQTVPDDAWTLMTMATVLSARLDLVGARRKIEQAIAIRPHLAAAKGEMARILVFSGQTKRGRILAAEALDASPRDPHASLWLRSQAIASWMEGDHAHAVAIAELAIEKRSNWYPNYLIGAVAYMQAGDLPAAKKAVETARGMGSDTLTMDALRCGHPFEDRKMFDTFVTDLKTAGLILR